MSDRSKGNKKEINSHIALFFDIETSHIEFDDTQKEENRKVFENYIKGINDDKLKHELENKFTLFNKNGLQLVYMANVIIGDLATGEILDSVFFTSDNPLEEFKEWLLNFSEKEKYICYIHNLSYEFSFMQRQWKPTAITGKNLTDYLLPTSQSVFVKPHEPIQLCLEEIPNIIFRDSLILLNKSVKKLGKEIGLDKLDYVYDKVRLPNEPLEELDYRYNERDNIIVFKSIYQKYFKNSNEFTLNNIPLTYTGNARYYFNQEYQKGTKTRGKASVHKSYINTTLDKFYSIRSYDNYCLSKRCYYGGLTTTNPYLFGQMIENVFSVDFTSSYPFEMIMRLFPYFIDGEWVEQEYKRLVTENPNKKIKRPFKPCDYAIQLEYEKADEYFQSILLGLNEDDLKSSIKNKDGIKAYYGLFIFKNLRLKNPKYIASISKHKLFSNSFLNESEESLFSRDEMVTLNGKVLEVHGDSILYLTNIHLDVINALYDYDEIRCEKLTCARMEKQLPSEFSNFILKNYRKKNVMKREIKKVENEVKRIESEGIKDEKIIETLMELKIEYALIKALINSMYGMKVEDKVKATYVLENGIIESYTINDNKLDTAENIYRRMVERENTEMMSANEKDLKRHLHIYEHGLFVTDYARKHLVMSSLEFFKHGFITYYTDTDSLKLVYDNELEEKTISKQIEIFEKVVNEHNKKIVNQYATNKRFNDFIKNENIKEVEKEELKELGTMDIETMIKGNIVPYSYFISLGAKKYAYIVNDGEKEEIKTVISGCSTNLGKCLTEYAKQNGLPLKDVLQFVFRNGTLIDEKISGRTISYFEELPSEFVKMTNKYNQCGGQIIKNTTYTLGIQDNDIITLMDKINQQEENNSLDKIDRVFWKDDDNKYWITSYEDYINFSKNN